MARLAGTKPAKQAGPVDSTHRPPGAVMPGQTVPIAKPGRPSRSVHQSDRGSLERMCMRNLLANYEERVFFKDLRSRFILVSAGFLFDQAPGWGLDDVVGKSDFDLFSDEHTVAAFEDEQRVIRTGEAMVAKIERETFRDRPDAWVSTTKMPLRDDEGQGMDESRRVLPEHRDVGDPFDGHKPPGQVGSQLVRVGKGARRCVHVNHRHRVLPPVHATVPPLQPSTWRVSPRTCVIRTRTL